MRKRHLAFATVIVLATSCSSDSATAPASSDRNKFVDTWAGSYSCLGGSGTADTLVISLGGGALDFTLILHANHANPDTVSGTLAEPNRIDVPQQTMGGFPGTAQVTYTSGQVAYSQSGLGITCGGTGYNIVP